MTVLLWPYLPTSAERLLDALGRARALARGGASWAPGAIEHVRTLESLFPKDQQRAGGRRPMIDSHTHLRPVRAAERRARGGRGGGRGDAHAHRRDRRRVVPRRAGRRRGLPAGLRRDRPPPQRRQGLRRRRPRRAAGARRARALRGDRRDGPRLLPRQRAAAADQERAFAAQIALAARDRQAARDPHPRGRTSRRSTSSPPKPTGSTS